VARPQTLVHAFNPNVIQPWSVLSDEGAGLLVIRHRLLRLEVFTYLQIWWQSLFCNVKITYNRINSTKTPASGEGDVSESKLMSEFGTVHEVVCALCQRVSAIRAVGVLVILCLRSGVSHVTGVGGP
jgi:hypothetical protein